MLHPGIEVGAVYPQIELRGDPDAVRRIGRGVEELGFDHLLAYDHVLGAQHDDRVPALTGPYDEHDPFHDPLMMFAYLAGRTERLRFATGVLILPQRQTALVARQAADLALLSGDRFRLGVGVGWNWVEYEALGEDFHTRGQRADEQIELLRRLWTQDVVDVDGRFDTVRRAALVPRPAGPIPVWVGGFSRPALERAARLGDGFMFAGGTDRSVGGLERLRQLVAEAGREPDAVGAEAIIPANGGPQSTADQVRAWADAGGTHASVVTMGIGLRSAEAHLDHLSAVAEALRR